MKKMIQDEKHLETIRIHRSDLKDIAFKDQGKEFMYKGEMYDVKNQTTDGEYMIFRCIKDKTEKRLIAGLQEQVNNNGGTDSYPGNKHNDSTKNPVKDLFFHRGTIAENFSIEVSYPPAICNPIAFILPPLPSPPPDFFIS